MTTQQKGLRTAAVVFGIVAILQLLRVIRQVDVVIGGYNIPLWPSVVAVVIAGSLSLWLWRLSTTP